MLIVKKGVKIFSSLLFFIFLVSFISADSFGYNTEDAEAGIEVTTNFYTGNLTNLSQLGDTNIPAPTDNYVLTWDDATHMWIAEAASAVGDTNESTRFGNLVAADCEGTDKVIGVQINGTVLCGVDISGAGGSYNVTYDALNSTYGIYWYNYTGTGNYYYNMSDGVGLWTTNGTIIYNDTATQFGIGTSSPLEYLHIMGDTIIETTDAYGVLHFGNYPDQAKIMGYDNTGGSVMAFYAGGQEVFKVGLAETVVNEGGLDGNFRIESSDITNIFFVDSANDKIGIGTSTPTHELNIIGSANVTENVTASYYFGNGTFLTGLSNLYSGIKWAYNQTVGSLVYLATASTNLQSNISAVNTSLITKINAISGGNASWNESLADTLYPEIKWGYNFTIGTFNQYGQWWYNMSDGGADGSYNLTYANWNKTYADTLYALIKWGYNMSDGGADGSYNLTYANWNKTYADTLYPEIKWGYNMSDGFGNTINGTRLTIENITNFDYNYNQSDGSYNVTYQKWAYNETFNESTLSTIYHNATQSTLVDGTLNAGSLLDTQHSDGHYDGKTFNFTEDAGSPGLDLRINFTGIEDFNRGVIRYKTSSLSGSFPIIQMWNYEDSVWEDYPSMGASLTFATITQPVFDSDNHVSGGIAQMRIYKAANGNTNNHYYVDWISIASGFGTPSGEEIDPYSFHRNENLNNTGFNITADYFFGDGSQLTNLPSGNSSWNESLASTLYSAIQWGYNQTIGSLVYLATASDNLQSNISAVNTSLIARYDPYNYNMSDGGADGSYNLTYANNNKTFFDTLYSPIKWAYNQTTPFITWLSSFVYNYNQTYTGGTYNSTYDAFAPDGSYNLTYSNWNKTYADTLYSLIKWSYNMTLDSDFDYNMSTPYDDFNYNMSDGGADGSYNLTYSNWNKTYADTLYSLIKWSYNMTLDSDFDYNMSTPYDDFNYNMSDGYAPMDYTNIAMTNQTNHFVPNQNMTNNNITGVQCIVFQSGGSICTA